MLATLGWVSGCIGARKRGGNAGRLVGVGAAAEQGVRVGAGVVPSILPTRYGAAMEPSSARSPAAGAVDWHACLCIVLVGGVGWPRLAVKGCGIVVGKHRTEGC